MILCTRVVLISCIMFIAGTMTGQVNIDTTASVKDDFEKFSYYLADLELYEMAAEEMEKSIFYEGESSDKLTSLFNFYTRSGQTPKIVKRMQTVVNKDEHLISLYLKSLIVSGYTHEASAGINKYSSLLQESAISKYKYEIALLDRDWRKASQYYESLNPLQKAFYSQFNSKIPPKGRKSKTKAMFFSGVIPTSGRFYARDYKDALVSLAFISGPAYQSYRRFDKNGIKSVGGWVYGGIAFGFYLGNIYGSGQSAKIYNLKKDNALLHEARDLIHNSYE